MADTKPFHRWGWKLSTVAAEQKVNTLRVVNTIVWHRTGCRYMLTWLWISKEIKLSKQIQTKALDTYIIIIILDVLHLRIAQSHCRTDSRFPTANVVVVVTGQRTQTPLIFALFLHVFIISGVFALLRCVFRCPESPGWPIITLLLLMFHYWHTFLYSIYATLMCWASFFANDSTFCEFEDTLVFYCTIIRFITSRRVAFVKRYFVCKFSGKTWVCYCLFCYYLSSLRLSIGASWLPTSCLLVDWRRWRCNLPCRLAKITTDKITSCF